MTRDETLRSIVKRRNGVTGLCKHINATGAAIVTEHELVALTTEDAKRQYGISNGPQAFNRRYRESEELQRALMTESRPLPIMFLFLPIPIKSSRWLLGMACQ